MAPHKTSPNLLLVDLKQQPNEIFSSYPYFFYPVQLFSQRIEVIDGLNHNSFYDTKDGEGHYRSSYEPGIGYSAKIRVEDIKVDWLELRFTIGYEKYGGKIKVRSSLNS